MRRATISRTTTETDIRLRLEIDAEHAPNEQAVMAIVKTFLDTVDTAFPVDADPVAVLTTVFGIEKPVHGLPPMRWVMSLGLLSSVVMASLSLMGTVSASGRSDSTCRSVIRHES